MLTADTLLAAPAEELVSIDEFLAWARVTSVDAEQLRMAADVIGAVRAHIEGQTGRALVPQSRRAVFRGFPCGRILRFGRAPLAAVSAVVYLDEDLAEQTLDSGLYHVATACEPGALVLLSGESWPTTACADDAVRIDYTTGQCSPELRQQFRTLVRQIATLHWDNPMGLNIGNIVNDLPFSGRSLIDANRVVTV